MKILAQAVANNTVAGFQRAAEAAGHKWVWWEEQHTPAFDVFDELQPDVLFFMEANRALLKCIQEFSPHMVQGFFHTPFEFDVNGQRLRCERLVDTHIFCAGDPDPAYECSVGIVCPPNPLGLSLCNQLGKLNVKIVCEQPWPVAQYLGYGSLMTKRDLYRHSTIVMVPDLLEAMRVIACGSIPYATDSTVNELTGIQVEPDELTDWIHQLEINPQIRNETIKQLQKLVVNRTYDTALTTISEAIK